MCEFSPLVFIYFTPIIGLAYSIAFLVKSFVTKNSTRTDYLIFVAIVTFPIIIGGLYLISNS